jgi:fatty acid CoA ligase FadD36
MPSGAAPPGGVPATVAAGHDIADAVAVGGVMLSRCDLVGAATSVAERVGGAQLVAVLAKPTATTVLAVTGCLIAGVPFVPVPPDVGVAERRHILPDSGAQAWLGELPDDLDGLPHVPVRLHARSWHRYPEPSPRATAMVMYTSGTTGLPKGVLISRQAVAADIDALAQAWQWTPDDTLVHGLPLFHVHGLVLGLLGSLRSEIAGTPEDRRRLPPQATVHCTSGCPLCGLDRGDRLRLAFRMRACWSAALPVPVLTSVRLTGHAPVERYGSTESLC